MTDQVNHPPHYNAYPMEVKDMIRLILGDEGYKAYCLGNELKYRLRAGLKDSAEVDIKKALFYLNERKQLED